MLENLTDRLSLLFKRIRGKGVLTVQSVDEALREVRLALLEADVHFKVVKSFIENVRSKAIGAEVLESLTPGQQVVKIVWKELSSLLGASEGTESSDSASGKDADILFKNIPTKVMLVGLQGTGKTTTAAKLALFYKKAGKKVLLVATDLKRPAACDQLRTLAESIQIPIILPEENSQLFSVVEKGLEAGVAQGVDLVIFDTAGRIELDSDLMDELGSIESKVSPDEVFLVADAMTGQSAVHVAERFHQVVKLTGIILTKVEGDARGGAMLSIRSITGAPIRYIGVGEKVTALERFYPDRMASRILGMGDILSVVERAQKNFTHSVKPIEKIKSNELTLEDFLEQLTQIKKMGNLTEILNMIPGGRGMMKQSNPNQMEKELRYNEAILSSMTRQERHDPDRINGSCRLRIAKGSGTSVEQVNRLLKQFYQAKKMFKTMSVGVGKRGFRNPFGGLFPSI